MICTPYPAPGMLVWGVIRRFGSYLELLLSGSVSGGGIVPEDTAGDMVEGSARRGMDLSISVVTDRVETSEIVVVGCVRGGRDAMS
jgi:hypothetical protein